MFHTIKEITSLENLEIKVIFHGGIEKSYDIRKMFDPFPQMKELENGDLFKSAVLDPGGYGISWNDELDIDAEEIWEDEEEIKRHQISLEEEVGIKIAKAREIRNMTQKELAEVTGISQANICKLEKGKLNPSLNILKRVAKGLNMNLSLDFIPLNTN